MTMQPQYDCCIIGGGLAGLSLSIQLARTGHNVALFEKEQYPFHKVCGEYISLESKPHLERLGLDLDSMGLPVITRLAVSAPSGQILEQALPLGGFGITRYLIDNELKKIAVSAGVSVYENCKVEEIVFVDNRFHVQTSLGKFHSKSCCGSFGKRSNLDLKWERPFAMRRPGKLDNYVAVKYHIRMGHPGDRIELHNFPGGYCGISGVEDGNCCLCYLTNAKNLKAHHNSIEEMERNVLGVNPHLKKIFSTAEKINIIPLTISQVSFSKKSQVEDHVLLLGDAAGMITPLCGNGMSMALHASVIAAKHTDDYLKGRTSRREMENNYCIEWNRKFSRRLRIGRLIQRFFGKTSVTNGFVKLMKGLPGLTRWLIRQTHGDSF